MIRWAIVGFALVCAGCGGEATQGTTKSTLTDGGIGGNSAGGAGGNAGTGITGSAIPAKCALNSDCPSALVCKFGRCAVECQTSKDCPAPQRCVQSTTGGGSVCQIQAEAICHFNSDCKDPLICAADLQCRNQCMADRDCLSMQTCVYGVCADPSEINPTTGVLVGAADAGSSFPGVPRDGGR